MTGKILDFLRGILARITARKIFLLAGAILIFFIALRPPIDPDMGWHLKNGEYLLEHDLKVAKKDIYSNSMAEFPLIMHEWLCDILMFSVYQKFNLSALSLLYALVAGVAFWVASAGVRAKKEYKMIAAILGAIASVPILGVRPQMFNLLFLACVIFVIFKFRIKKESRIIFWLPPLFAVWANMHGGFAAGLFLVGVFVAVEVAKLFFNYLVVFFSLKSNFFAKLRPIGQKNLLGWPAAFGLAKILAASTLATLLNPYGWRIYIEVVTTVFDSYAKANISEWLPLSASNPMSFQFIVYLAFLVILLLFSRKKTDLTYLAVTVPFLYLAFSSWRHMPIFLIISTPLWVNIVETLVGSELLALIRKKWFLLLFLVACLFIIKQSIDRTFPLAMSVQKMAEAVGYPYKAVNWLKANPREGKMFNEYNWGGFLIWQYPQKKVFIDGRMASWKMGERRIFKEFNTMVKLDEGWREKFEQNDFDFALVYNNYSNKIIFKELGWKEIYRDDLAIIFEVGQK